MASRTDQLLTLCRQASGGRGFPERLAAMAPTVLALTRATSTTVGVVQLPADRAPLPLEELTYSLGLGLDQYLEYLGEHFLDDPLQSFARRADGVPVLLSEHLRAQGGRRAGARFDGFLRQLGIRHVAGCARRMPDGSIMLLGVHRPPRARDFTQRDLSALRMLSVDLARAAAGSVLCRMLSALPPPSAEFPAIVALDAGGAIVDAHGPGPEWVFARLGDDGARLLSQAERQIRQGGPTGIVRQLPDEELSWKGHLLFTDSRSGVGGLLLLSRREREQVGPLPAQLAHHLTSRQQAVLRLLAARLSNEEIGDLLEMRPGTLRTHLRRIYRRLGFTSRRALQAALSGRPPWSE